MLASPETRKRLKPQLKLNTAQTIFENKVNLRKNSANGYVIENSPLLADLSKSASASKIDPNHFFNLVLTAETDDNYSQIGDYYCILQKSNGKEMQDKFKVLPTTPEKDMAYFAVFDGHSTNIIPDVVAQKLDQFLLENLQQGDSMTSALKKAFQTVEEEIIVYLKEKKKRGGTTALCTILRKDLLYVANLGDSQAVMFKNNKFVCLSNLHDYNNENEKNLVEQKGGIILKNRLEGELALSRSIGDYRFKKFLNSEPEIHTYQIDEEDEFLIIATDGFWNGLAPELVFDKIKEYRTAKQQTNLTLECLGRFLMDEACNNIKTKKDNMSVIIISVQGYLNS